MHRKQNFEIAFLFESDTIVLTYFSLSLLPSFLLSLPHFLVDFSLVEKVFKKALRILRLDKGKVYVRGFSGTRFLWKSSGQCYIFSFFLQCP